MRFILLAGAAGCLMLTACGDWKSGQANSAQGNISQDSRPPATAVATTAAMPTGAPATKDEALKIMHERHDASASFQDYVRVGRPFGPIEEHAVEWVERMSRARFLDLVRSRSHYLTASPEEQRSVIASLETLLTTHPDVAGAEELAIPYVTRCFRTRLA